MKERRPSGEPVLAEVGPPVILSLGIAGYLSVLRTCGRGGAVWSAVAGSLLALTVTGVVAYAQESPVTADEWAYVEQFIQRQVGSGRASDGQPVSTYKPALIVLAGQAESAQQLLAAQFTIESGVSWRVHLAVFDRASRTLLARREVGGKERRSVTLKAVRSGRILFDSMEYQPQDASCCPSRPGSVEFRLVGDVLEEVSPSAAR
jgi:hypothetical protein